MLAVSPYYLSQQAGALGAAKFFEAQGLDYGNSNSVQSQNGWNKQLGEYFIENCINSFSGYLGTTKVNILIGKLNTIINS